VKVAEHIAEHERAIRAWELYPCARCEHAYSEHCNGERGRPRDSCTHRACGCVAFLDTYENEQLRLLGRELEVGSARAALEATRDTR